MTDPDPAWAEGQAQYDALVRDLAETLDLDAGLQDALAHRYDPEPVQQNNARIEQAWRNWRPDK